MDLYSHLGWRVLKQTACNVSCKLTGSAAFIWTSEDIFSPCISRYNATEVNGVAPTYAGTEYDRR